MYQVTCEAGKEPERFRAVVRVLVHSCDGRGVSFGSEYVAVRAEIQEPTVRESEKDIPIQKFRQYPLTIDACLLSLACFESKC